MNTWKHTKKRVSYKNQSQFRSIRMNNQRYIFFPIRCCSSVVRAVLVLLRVVQVDQSVDLLLLMTIEGVHRSALSGHLRWEKEVLG